MHDLEFDVRGQTEAYSNNIHIQVGEIKSGKGWEFAQIQLIKRLTVIALAGSILTDSNVNKILHGEIYTTKSEWQSPTREMIENIRVFLKLKTFGEIDIEVVQII